MRFVRCLKSTLIVICYCCFLTTIVNAQKIISTAGKYSETENISLSWTIGEGVVSTIKNTHNVLSQGFHQDSLRVIDISRPSFPEVNISAYPNPARNYVHLDVDEDEENSQNIEYEYLLCNLSGKIIEQKKMEGNNAIISLQNLRPSIYFIKILKNDIVVKAFKIIKP